MKRKGRRASTAPHDLAVRLASILPEPNALIGALAVAAHGYVRATEDIDFVSPAHPREIQMRLAESGIESKKRRVGVLEGDIASVVYGALEGIRFDVISPPVPIDWEQTVVLPLTKKSRLRVVNLETLIRLKLRAGSPQDLLDVVHLVRLHPESEEKSLALADAYGIRGRLTEWLADPRIRSPPPDARARGSARRGARSRR